MGDENLGARSVDGDVSTSKGTSSANAKNMVGQVYASMAREH